MVASLSANASAECVLAFHGAAGTVTGSCYELRHDKTSILVDCGLFQGPRSLEALNFADFEFDVAGLDCILLTHAHLDHSGLLPRLTAKGFSGAVWCTPATAELLGPMLRDSARLNEQDTARRNRRRDRADEPPIEPLYTTDDVEKLLQQLRVAKVGELFSPIDGASVKFWNAGHVLGSASIEICIADTRLLFSGDLGSGSAGLLDDPEGPAGVDHLIIEATYGDRDRTPVTIAQRQSQLEAEVKAALGRGGNLLIPAFALERTQELLLDLATLINAGRLKHMGVFIDSPLATKITAVFAKHVDELDGMALGEVFRHPSFHYVEDVQRSRAIGSLSGAIIIAGSGMCEGGRMRHHLLDNLARADSTLLFVGYQAAGTLGRTILEGARRVRVSGEDVAVRLNVREIESYSAHADRGELIKWASDRRPVAGSIFVTHGEQSALASLGEALKKSSNSVTIPELGEIYALSGTAAARRVRPGRVELREVLNRDWQNDYADLAVNLKRQLAGIRDDRLRREALGRMRDVLDSYHVSKTAVHRQRSRIR